MIARGERDEGAAAVVVMLLIYVLIFALGGVR